VAKVAVARKLAVRMYWMLRSTADYAQLVRMQGSPRSLSFPADSSCFRLNSESPKPGPTSYV